jgi:hypothetical protein
MSGRESSSSGFLSDDKERTDAMLRKKNNPDERTGFHDGFEDAFGFENYRPLYPYKHYVEGYEKGFRDGVRAREALIEQEQRQMV